MTRRTGRLTVAAVAAGVCVAAGGGYAVAASGRDATVTACVSARTHALYVGRCARHDSRLSWNEQGPRGRRGATGATGPAGPAGATGPQGIQGVAGADGTAKAYGLWSGTALSESKNVASATSPATGVVCVTVNGVSPANEGAVAMPDYSTDDTVTSNMAHVEWESSGSGCAPGEFEFRTFDVTVAAGVLNVADKAEGFFFVIP